MKKILFGVLAASTLALGASPAIADPGDDYAGGCAFNSISDPTPDGNLGGQDAYNGEVDYQVVLFNSTNPAANPVSATVSCELTVNGVTQDSTAATHWTVVGAGAETLSFVAAEDDVVALCTVVDFDAADATDVRDCGDATTIQIPPQEVIDAVEGLEILLDTVICPVLVLLAPGVPGVVDIKVGEGDTSLLGDPFWDCPPYGNFFPEG